MPDDLYERDFYAWAVREAGLLQQLAQGERVNDALDAANLAEEIESLGRSQKREISSRLRVLLTHMLKWQYQREARSGSWEATVREQRRELEAVLDDSPSLRSIVPERLVSAYKRALTDAEYETRLPRSAFPDTCPYTAEQILDLDYLPGRHPTLPETH